MEVLPDAEACAQRAAELLAAWIERAAEAAPAAPVHVLLAGGSTPRRCYELLAGRALPWARLRAWLGDERRVPQGAPERNARMVRETLVAPGRLRAADVGAPGEGSDWPGDASGPMDEAAADADAAARAYEARLPAAFAAVLLGLGADGHTASLFPGSPALAERARRVVAAPAPVAPHGRWTVTPPVIEAAPRVLVLATGAGKAGAVATALAPEGDPIRCPARLARHATWIVDRDAAERLPPAARMGP